MKRIIIIITSALLMLSGNICLAYDFAEETTVNLVEGSYIPHNVHFKINNQPSQCGWLVWYPGADDAVDKQRDNVKAVYQGLMMALITGRTVKVYGSYTDGSSNCSIDYIHFR